MMSRDHTRTGLPPQVRLEAAVMLHGPGVCTKDTALLE